MFKEIVLYTNQIKALQRFYANVLELDVTDISDGAFTTVIGSTNLVFQYSEEDARYHYAINIPGNQFVILKHWMQDRLVLNKKDGENDVYHTSFDADAMYFEDPAGNLIELIGRRNRDLFGGVTKDMFLDVSEVALVTADVAYTGEALQDFGIPLRHGALVDPKKPNLLGKHSAFIVVTPEDWKWRFAKEKAKPFPVEITLNDNKQIKMDEEGELELIAAPEEEEDQVDE